MSDTDTLTFNYAPTEFENNILTIKNSIKYNKNKIKKLTNLIKISNEGKKELANKAIDDIDKKNYENIYIDNIEMAKNKIKLLKKQISSDMEGLEFCENIKCIFT